MCISVCTRVGVYVCLVLLPSICPWPFTLETHADFMGGCKILSPSPCPCTPASLLRWHRVPIQLRGPWTPRLRPSLPAGMPPTWRWQWGGGGRQRGHRGHGRRGRQVPGCCWSWLNIVSGQLGNTNHSGKEMKLLEQTRCAWQGSRLRDKVLPSPCQPARVIY